MSQLLLTLMLTIIVTLMFSSTAMSNKTKPMPSRRSGGGGDDGHARVQLMCRAVHDEAAMRSHHKKAKSDHIEDQKYLTYQLECSIHEEGFTHPATPSPVTTPLIQDSVNDANSRSKGKDKGKAKPAARAQTDKKGSK